MTKIILVMGGASFIGSHLCERLRDKGYKVTSLDNYSTGTTENHIDGVKYIKGATKNISELIHDDVDTVFHNDSEVMHISGYFFPVKENLPKTFFYNQTSCWGWATWRRAWSKIDLDANFLVNEIQKLDAVDNFNIDGSYPSFYDQLSKNASGKLNTWAIKWQASVFLSNGLCLHPSKSFTKNIGNDGTGTNSGKTKRFSPNMITEYNGLVKIPLCESSHARNAMVNYYKGLESGKLKTTILRIIRNIKKYVFSY